MHSFVYSGYFSPKQYQESGTASCLRWKHLSKEQNGNVNFNSMLFIMLYHVFISVHPLSLLQDFRPFYQTTWGAASSRLPSATSGVIRRESLCAEIMTAGAGAVQISHSATVLNWTWRRWRTVSDRSESHGNDPIKSLRNQVWNTSPGHLSDTWTICAPSCVHFNSDNALPF